MRSDFAIHTNWLEGHFDDKFENASYAEITIQVNGTSFTELEDLSAHTIRPSIRASAYSLARWFMQCWWRLQCEPFEDSNDWRMAHCIASAGDGFAWPDISIACDGEFVSIKSRRTEANAGMPVRYLHSDQQKVRFIDFEKGVFSFVDRVTSRVSTVLNEPIDLAEVVREIRQELRDPELQFARVMEALMSEDPGEVPAAEIKELRSLSHKFGQDIIEDLVVRFKRQSSQKIEELVLRLNGNGIAIRIPDLADRSEENSSGPIWSIARKEAQAARAAWGIPAGPVENQLLGELFSVSEQLFSNKPANDAQITAGYRENRSSHHSKIQVQRASQTGRRFEFVRLIAAHLNSGDEAKLFAVANSYTSRQKYQRAFAQEFLFPLEEMVASFQSSIDARRAIDDDEIEEVAQHYIVSPLFVKTTLVNHHYLSRDQVDWSDGQRAYA